jgi:hypothetical protein
MSEWLTLRGSQTRYPVAIQRLLHYPPLRGEKVNEKQPGIGVSRESLTKAAYANWTFRAI